MSDYTAQIPTHATLRGGLAETNGNRQWMSVYSGVPKRCLDLLLLAIFAPVYLPVVAMLYLLARMDGGPGFFSHARVGRNGVMFRCHKIRTMVPDAESALEAYLAAEPARRAKWEADVKLDMDPRVTRVGAFLRRSSLDELPQLWNIFTGEMSFVGPRPVTIAEMDRYGEDRAAYLAMRPGLTGFWQVCGRNSVSYAERVAMDVAYARMIGLLTDLRLIARTAVVVLRRTGC